MTVKQSLSGGVGATSVIFRGTGVVHSINVDGIYSVVVTLVYTAIFAITGIVLT